MGRPQMGWEPAWAEVLPLPQALRPRLLGAVETPPVLVPLPPVLLRRMALLPPPSVLLPLPHVHWPLERQAAGHCWPHPAEPQEQARLLLGC